MATLLQSLTRLARPTLTKNLTQPTRTFTTFTPLRPSLTPSTLAIRRTALPTSFTPTGAADLVPTSAISAHPALGDLQIRCGPRNTMNGATRLVQKRRHGFLYRMRSRTGRKILQRRRIKGRKYIAQ
ncbi:Fc.00g047670.m01.CDS01 [Cosmosporella sp. VM-42]